MNSVTQCVAAIICLSLSAISQAQTAEMPIPSSFNVGDKWEWRRIDNRTKQEEGKFSRTVVKIDGILQFSDGAKNHQISQEFLGKPSTKPWRVWPLAIGKKWEYEEDWTRDDGATGNTKQNVEVVAYEEVTVPAGKFMAFKIEYKGWYRRNGGRSGKQNDTYWYAPDAKANVKRTRDDGHNMYTQELVIYTKAAP